MHVDHTPKNLFLNLKSGKKCVCIYLRRVGCATMRGYMKGGGDEF